MRDKLAYLGAALLAVGITACHDELTTGREGETFAKTPLAIRASVRSAAGGAVDESAYKAFPAGKQIHIYYAHNNLEQAYDFMQGLYKAPGGDKQANWIPQEWQPGQGGMPGQPDAEPVNSIYVEDIKTPNSDGRYFFTATSYPEPRVAGGGSSLYEVALDQTSLTGGFDHYDFLAARAVYADAGWKDASTGITLHFRHLLSQLRVQLILPEGKADDGLFPAPGKAAIRAALLGKHSRYSVTFNNRTETGGIFGISVPGESGVGDLKMRYDGVTGPLTVNGREVYCHTFSAILPKQTLYGGKLLGFTIDGEAYSYTPPLANTVLLEQEKITTVQLTVLSGPGKQKVTLNSVTLLDWVEDKADVGDLIPQ